MACHQCRTSLLGALEARQYAGQEDPRFDAKPGLFLEGFDSPRVCRVCGSVYYPKKEPRAAPEPGGPSGSTSPEPEAPGAVGVDGDHSK